MANFEQFDIAAFPDVSRRTLRREAASVFGRPCDRENVDAVDVHAPWDGASAFAHLVSSTMRYR